MTYSEALEYIHSICWTFTKPGLERISALCEKLGDPQNDLRFIHVAGTNGKGSFCSMLDSVLRHAGYKTGLFTSPYIRVFNERMQFCGENIADAELAEITEYVKPFADSMEDKPTEFELITSIAFEFFKRKKCDVVILECGMGGRLDSTNIISSSLLSVITGISLDHTAFLGNTVEEIAAEKAGIIKPGGKVLFGGRHGTVEDVIKRKAAQMSAEYYFADKLSLKITGSDLCGSTFDYKGYTALKLPLLGMYQPENAANVLSAVEILNREGFSVTESAVREGLRAARWPARFEIISRDPLVIFDGAHNPEGIDTATASIKHYFGERRVAILTGVMRDKDYVYIARKFAQISDRAFTLTPDNPRALPANEYAAVLGEAGIKATAHSSVREAFAEALSFARQTGAPLVCLGSLYMYCEIMNNL